MAESNIDFSLPIASRTRSRKFRISPFSRVKQLNFGRPAVSGNGVESSIGKKSFDWVVAEVEILGREDVKKKMKNEGKEKTVEVGVKRKRRLGLDDSDSIAVSDDGVEVTAGKEGGGDPVADTSASDKESDEDTDSSSDEIHSDEGTDSSSDENYSDEDTDSSSDEDDSDVKSLSSSDEDPIVENDKCVQPSSDEDTTDEDQTEGTKRSDDRINDGNAEKQFGPDEWNQVQKARKRGPKKRRVATIPYEAPKVESIPLKFTFREHPTLPEKSGGSSEAWKKHEGAEKFIGKSIAKTKDYKAKRNSLRRSGNIQKDDGYETYGGSTEACKKNGELRELHKKKRSAATKDFNVAKVLIDSIFEEEEESGEVLAPSGDEAPKDKAPKDETLPQLFPFGHPPSPAPEEPKFEREEDTLFEELNLVLASCAIGSSDSNVVENDDTVPPVEEVHQDILCSQAGQVENNDSVPPVKKQYILCSQGNHCLTIDEEIGLICQFCRYIHREIKYILPDFVPNPYGRSGKRFYEEDNRSILDELQCNDPCDSGSISHDHAEGTVWELIPGVKDSLYPHQREGFEFIWRHIGGGTDLQKLAKPGAGGGKGCIISHAPGTGKTRLTIIFIQSYMKFNPTCKPLIVAPRTMLLTWEEEFKKWDFDIPFHNLNHSELSGKEEAANLLKGAPREKVINWTRIVKLHSWKKKRSILGISYSLFEKICGASSRNGYEAEQMAKMLIDFPGLVVFDEGHNARNERSNWWNALLKIKTRRRILLSGTLFQNNFCELYNTILLARPEFVWHGAFDDKKQGRKSNAGKGQWINTKLANEIRGMITPFMHVCKGTMLQSKLPGLQNSVVVLRSTKLQKSFYKRIQVFRHQLLKYEPLEAKVSIHPSLLLEEREYSSDRRLEKNRLNPGIGVKANFTIELIRLCHAMNERVLVFSQLIDPLELIGDLLKSQFQWDVGHEVLYMDGNCDAKDRQLSMQVFNDPSSKAKVLLASTKSCNEGINLVGASRVVLLDVTWNPSVERQAISRAYRLGQKKVVFIYHLLMDGAREEEKYCRQVEKHRLSKLVLCCSDKNADVKKIGAGCSEDKILEVMVEHDKLRHIFEKITLLDEVSFFE